MKVPLLNEVAADKDGHSRAPCLREWRVPDGVVGGSIEADGSSFEAGSCCLQAVSLQLGFLQAHHVGAQVMGPQMHEVYDLLLLSGKAADVVGNDA